jgi:hypothetical protein
MILTTVRHTAFHANSLSDVACLLDVAIEEGATQLRHQPTHLFGRYGARDWELTRWFKRTAALFDGLCDVLGILKRQAPTSALAAKLASDLEALLETPLNDEGDCLGRWGLRRWRNSHWELDNLELDYQLRSQPEALLAALEAFERLHFAPLLAGWKRRVGQDLEPHAWELAG